MDHYRLLGIEPGATVAQARRAYLAAARRHHPDFYADATEEVRREHEARMTELNEAWAVLSDPRRRAEYDHRRALADDPGVARRNRREPTAPAGKGWTPRADDDGWMHNFEAWAAESEELPADRPASAGRNLATLAPLALFLLGLLLLLVGLALDSRPALAAAVVATIISAGLFVLVPVFSMTRRR